MRMRAASWPLFAALLAFGLFAFLTAPPAVAQSPEKDKAPKVTHEHSAGHVSAKSHGSHSGGLPPRDIPAVVGTVAGVLGALGAFNGPPAQPGAGPPPAGPYWYWCDASHRYYPYAATCASGWRAVPPR